MKMLLLVFMVSLSVGCSATADRKQKMIDGAATCNSICQNNPEIGEYSQKMGGGMPLLFMGGMEVKCACSRSK
ncbi:MAG: hypothetical protein OEL79_04150 [Chromatiales bacterium]|nr:hypothetical protein [Chromatiales bacterium]